MRLIARIATWGTVALGAAGQARGAGPTPTPPSMASPAGAHRPSGSSPSLANPTGDLAPVGEGAADPLPGPAPFADTAPLLPEMWRLVTARDAHPRALLAGIQVLDDWLLHPTSDEPLARATADYLRARLLSAAAGASRLPSSQRRDLAESARAAWEALATTPGAFSDEARVALAALEPRAKNPRPGGAAHWLITRSPGAPGYIEGVRKAVKDLSHRRQGARAAELLADALQQGMADDTRRELLLLRADLLAPDEARALLTDAWWLGDDPHPDARIASRLKKLKASPDADAEAFREALTTPRGDKSKRARTSGRGEGRPIGVLAEALADRWDDDAAAAALKAVDRVEKALADTPYPAFTRAVLLRKLDRDADAVTAFGAVIDRFPSHPLADLARAQSSVLLRALGRAREADVLDQALLAVAPPGPLERDALWRLGFGAILRGDGAAAEVHLRDLERRYGGDPDRHSFCWYERARYWRGRAAQLAGDKARADELWKGAVERFPAGWYALLARDRLGARARVATSLKKTEADAMWDVGRDDPMATALALYRLGAETEAREAFTALLDAQQLPGNGRKLLADLWDLDGKSQKADRVLRYAAIPATMPGDDPDELYLSWYPFVHGDAVSEAAHDNHLPSQLLAGIVSVETRFQAKGHSRVGAIGLAQLMPTTGQAIGKKIYGASFKASQLWDPATNLAVAARYLSSLMDRFAGHPALAVAAYNAGPAPVKRWLAERGRLELDAFVETIPFEQARRYVMRVLSDAEIYRRLYGLEPEPLTLPRALSDTP